MFKTQKALADAIGASPQQVNNWKKRGVPPTMAKKIEEATEGKVSRKELAPDIFA